MPSDKGLQVSHRQITDRLVPGCQACEPQTNNCRCALSTQRLERLRTKHYLSVVILFKYTLIPSGTRGNWSLCSILFRLNLFQTPSATSATNDRQLDLASRIRDIDETHRPRLFHGGRDILSCSSLLYLAALRHQHMPQGAILGTLVTTDKDQPDDL